MKLPQAVGWVLVIVGILMISSPLFSGFTGFFVTTFSIKSVPDLDFGVNWKIIVAGAVLTGIGLALANPKKETILR